MVVSHVTNVQSQNPRHPSQQQGARKPAGVEVVAAWLPMGEQWGQLYSAVAGRYQVHSEAVRQPSCSASRPPPGEGEAPQEDRKGGGGPAHERQTSQGFCPPGT